MIVVLCSVNVTEHTVISYTTDQNTGYLKMRNHSFGSRVKVNTQIRNKNYKHLTLMAKNLIIKKQSTYESLE